MIPYVFLLAGVDRRRLRGPRGWGDPRFTLLLVGLTLLALTEWIARRREYEGLSARRGCPAPAGGEGMSVLPLADAFSADAFTALVAGAILPGSAAVRCAGRAGLRARRRAEHRARGDDAVRGVRRLRRRLPRRQLVARLRRRHARRGRHLADDGLFCVRLGLDQIVVGIAIVLGAEGATALIFDSQFAESRPTLPAVSRVSIPGLSDLPVVGGKGESDEASSASRSSSTSASRSSWSWRGCCGERPRPQCQGRRRPPGRSTPPA